MSENVKSYSLSNLFKGFITVESVCLKETGKKIKHFERVNKKSAVCALVLDKTKQKFIFVKQWRAGSLNEQVEVVAGHIEEGENPEECIKREIVEELGYKVDFCQQLVTPYYPSVGFSNEKIYTYFCVVTEKIGEGGGLIEEGEEIEIVEMDLKEMVTAQFEDAKAMLAISSYVMNTLT